MSKYSPQHHVLKHPQLILGLHNKPKVVVHELSGPKKKNTLSFLSSRNVNDQVSHPYKTTNSKVVNTDIEVTFQTVQGPKFHVLNVGKM